MKSNDQILEYMGKRPQIHESVFLAPGSQVIGDVVIGKNSSIWFQTLVRGDVNYIRIGENVNIQDLTIIHVARDVYPVEIGNNVSIGHRATIHGCKLKDNSFVGMCATLMDDVEVGEFAFIGAGALITPGKKIPPGVLVMGSPGKIIRDITDKEREIIVRTTNNYIKYKENYLQDPFYNRRESL
ncbi:gamma carbonic anhydrase family protein [Leptospira noguchii]|uniref:gamma carbonic anhydrase family protein n=1 Tax=Leptospira noguchii TaxID=28182 RepID=UPI00055A8980|nr:gamma carbonic anhydrase family protein [Leptospira noguchii]